MVLEHKDLPPSLLAYTNDSTRFEGLVEGLSAAKLHAVAQAVRESRANLTVPSHALYTSQRILAGRNDAFSPIYVTPKGSNGARRCTVSGTLVGVGQSHGDRPETPAALYSSKFLLKQFADGPPSSPSRPRTASASANTNAWRGPVDSHANQSLYERHRATGLGGWNAVPPQAKAAEAEVLDVEAERADAQAAEPSYVFGSVLREAAEAEEVVELEAAEPPADREEEITPTAAPRSLSAYDFSAYDHLAINKLSIADEEEAGGRAMRTRRSLQMIDAAAFYETVASAPPPAVQTKAEAELAQVTAATNIARQRALQMQRSDIFGRVAIEGRPDYTIGPNVADRPRSAWR